jgi:hypothetical protein
MAFKNLNGKISDFCQMFVNSKKKSKILGQASLGLKNLWKIQRLQERAVFGKMKMDPAKRAQTQNAGEVSSLQWFFSQSVELMTDKVCLHCIRPMLLK